MSSKFGLIDDADDAVARPEGKIDLSGFAPVQKRSPIDFAEVDAAAAPHGFVSREAAPVFTEASYARTTAPGSTVGAYTSFGGAYGAVPIRSVRRLR